MGNGILFTWRVRKDVLFSSCRNLLCFCFSFLLLKIGKAEVSGDLIDYRTFCSLSALGLGENAIRGVIVTFFRNSFSVTIDLGEKTRPCILLVECRCVSLCVE